MSSYRLGEPVAGEVEFFRHDVVAGNLSRPAPPLKAVLAGDRKMDVAKNRVDVRNRSPADERQGAARGVVELENQAAQDSARELSPTATARCRPACRRCRRNRPTSRAVQGADSAGSRCDAGAQRKLSRWTSGVGCAGTSGKVSSAPRAKRLAEGACRESFRDGALLAALRSIRPAHL